MLLHALVLATSILGSDARSLSLQERVAARRAVEEVLWSHRTWPEDNGTPKPGLEAWLTADALQRQVEDDLRKSQALARFWNRPVTPSALQAELDRMVRNSQAPEVLREILEALHGDAALAAEVLARPALVDRLARAAFAYDARIHGDAHRRALAARGRVTDLAALRGAADHVVAMRYVRGSSSPVLTPVPTEPLDEETWSRVAEPLRTRGLGEMGPLEEDERTWTVTAVTAKDADSITVSTAVWEKESFDAWWNRHREGFAMDAPDPISDYTLGTPAPGNPCTNDTWYPLKRSAPSARMEPVWVWTGSEMIVWGGGSGITGALATGGRYRPDIDAWTEVTTTGAPSARRHATAVWTGTEMIVWGGDDGASPNPIAVNTGGRYNPALDQWTATSTSGAPSARSYATSVWTGSAMIVWGGIGLPISHLQTGGVYNPTTNSWTATTLTGAPWPRYGHTATWTGSEMLVWGGENGVFLDSGARYNPATDSWVATTAAGQPGARAWHTAVWFNGGVTIWGGQRTGTTMWNTGATYVLSDGWIALSSTSAPLGRMHHSAVVVQHPTQNDRMVIFGGQAFDAFNNLFDVPGGGAYRQFQNDWLSLSGAGAPSARRWSAAVGTGPTMIVWGGASGSTAQGDGRRFDAFADVWSGMSSSGTPGPSPGPRTGHTLVYTGAETVVWGGLTPSSAFASGGSAYNLATDSWAALPDLAGLSNTYWHTAVWTGSVMLVWGGERAGGASNGGASWNGSGWIAMDFTGAPSVRRRHSAVWAGSLGMIVWGGDAGFVGLNDGGIYYHHPLFGEHWDPPPSAAPLAGRALHTASWTGTHMVVFGGASALIYGDGAAFHPLTNTWALLPSAGAPGNRYRHTAVWTGNEVVVWGGFSGSNLANGGRYNPALNSWSPVAPSGLAGRDMLEATWTGQEMIVWGGRKEFGVAAGDGARYNPGFDGWTPMSSQGAPSPRYDHRARQAGSEMVVWGGSSNTDTGGRYCASCAVLSGFEAAKNLTFSNPTTLVWSAHGGTTYSVHRGTLAAGSPPYNHTCFQSGLTSATASVTANPAPETAYYYLVGASNACSRTHLGSGTGGLRPNPSCP